MSFHFDQMLPQALTNTFTKCSQSIWPVPGFLFYRWEIILRESAILGILGVYTLGFYVDSAMGYSF